MKYIKIFMILLATGAISNSFGQKHPGKGDHIVFLLRQPEHFAQAIKTIAVLKETKVSTIKPSKVAIILCGEMLKNISSEEMKLQLDLAVAQEITVYACGLSLHKLGISKESLPSNVQYVENGLIKSLELQKKGYLSIEL